MRDQDPSAADPAGDAPAPLVEVAIVGAGRGPQILTWAVPTALEGAVRPGVAVRVPLGTRTVHGVVLRPSTSQPPQRIRAILDVDPGLVLPAELLDLAEWAARYYQVPIGALLAAVVPTAVRRATRELVVPTTTTEPENLSLVGDSGEAPLRGKASDLLRDLARTGTDLASLKRSYGRSTARLVKTLVDRGLARIEHVEIERRAPRRPLLATGAEAPPFGRARRRAEIHSYLVSRLPWAVAREELDARFPRNAAIVRALLDAGLIREADPGEVSPTRAVETLPLREEQRIAVDEVTAGVGRFEPYLLFGVTGSGKTEVYLQIARRVRESGRGVLLLVPEIGLTPQLIERAEAHFPGQVAVLHSGLSETERWHAWRDLATGRTPVAIGARSAVFAPVKDLGLIVVDEEHDGAYKQEESPRYHGRDVAVMRAKLAGCPVVLASATPSLESYQAARTDRYRMLRLPRRANDSALPRVELVDLRLHKPEDGRSPDDRSLPYFLAPELGRALVQTYRAGEQSLLFLNRRGYDRFVQCDACGRVETCPECSVSLTRHRAESVAVCHHCGFRQAPRSGCPDCGEALQAKSFGTEQLEEAAARLLPAARIARLDRDTTSSPEKLRHTLHAWRQEELDILVGTQMIAKGHDAPGVTLIGVVLADAALSFPDFRASERAFQLLTQVAGRAGRGSKPGRVIVQTRQPDHPSLVAARRHDFVLFADGELSLRQTLGYPPFGRLARIVVEGENEARVTQRSQALAERLERHAAALAAREDDPGEVLVLGPAPAPLEKLRGRHRHQLLIKSDRPGALGSLLRGSRLDDGPPELRTLVDVDPVSML